MQRTPSLRDTLKLRADRLSEDEAQEVLDYIQVMQTLRSPISNPIDEFVAMLLFESLATGTPN